MNIKKEKICTGCGRSSLTPLGLNHYGDPYLACCPDNNYVDVETQNNKKQTAVDYLVQELIKFQIIEKDGPFTAPIIEKAKELEKQQRIRDMNKTLIIDDVDIDNVTFIFNNIEE